MIQELTYTPMLEMCGFETVPEPTPTSEIILPRSFTARTYQELTSFQCTQAEQKQVQEVHAANVASAGIFSVSALLGVLGTLLRATPIGKIEKAWRVARSLGVLSRPLQQTAVGGLMLAGTVGAGGQIKANSNACEPIPILKVSLPSRQSARNSGGSVASNPSVAISTREVVANGIDTLWKIANTPPQGGRGKRQLGPGPRLGTKGNADAAH